MAITNHVHRLIVLVVFICEVYAMIRLDASLFSIFLRRTERVGPCLSQFGIRVVLSPRQNREKSRLEFKRPARQLDNPHSKLYNRGEKKSGIFLDTETKIWYTI